MCIHKNSIFLIYSFQVGKGIFNYMSRTFSTVNYNLLWETEAARQQGKRCGGRRKFWSFRCAWKIAIWGENLKWIPLSTLKTHIFGDRRSNYHEGQKKSGRNNWCKSSMSCHARTCCWGWKIYCKLLWSLVHDCIRRAWCKHSANCIETGSRRKWQLRTAWFSLGQYRQIWLIPRQRPSRCSEGFCICQRCTLGRF